MPGSLNSLASGIYYNAPREGAPEYVKAGLSFRRSEFIQWLNQQDEDAKGYIKIDVLVSKGGKLYCKLNDWKPKEKEPVRERMPDADAEGDDGNAPF
jgi:hypothetical protein